MNAFTKYFTAMLLLVPGLLICQTSSGSIRKVDEGFYLMYYDSSAIKKTITKSAVVEFSDCIALIEMPVSAAGAGTVHLSDHSEAGEKVLAALDEYFPGKPLRYLLSSHWHPHSISSVTPFLSRGITLVTTRKNFRRISEMADSSLLEKYRNSIRFVEGDSMRIGDGFNSIIAWRVSKRDYPSMPVEDFLYFQLPKYNYLHSSCMYQRYAGSLVRNKELVSPRTEDLAKFLDLKGIAPLALIGTDVYWDEANGMASADTMRMVLRSGTKMSTIEHELLSASNEVLVNRSDSIVVSFMTGSVPTVTINNAVYACLRKKDLEKALILAKLQTFVNPSDPNIWDTLGEVYYFRGESELAKKYESQSRRIDKNYLLGGEKTWQKNREDYEKLWNGI